MLNRLLARRLTVPVLAEPASQLGPALQLRPLLAFDEAEVVRYCSDAALARYTLNIPIPIRQRRPATGWPAAGARRRSDWAGAGR